MLTAIEPVFWSLPWEKSRMQFAPVNVPVPPPPSKTPSEASPPLPIWSVPPLKR